jgi:hypothetical protein
MGFFLKFFGSSVRDLAPGRGWTTPVVGESHFQPNIERQYRSKGGTEHDLKVLAVLAPDDGNAFGANAVRVEISGDPVGFLSRELAQEYRGVLGSAKSQCGAKIVGGFVLNDGSSAYFGVKLNVSWPLRFK